MNLNNKIAEVVITNSFGDLIIRNGVWINLNTILMIFLVLICLISIYRNLDDDISKKKEFKVKLFYLSIMMCAGLSAWYPIIFGLFTMNLVITTALLMDLLNKK